MIVISTCTSNKHTTWVVYVKGRVIGRSTRSVDSSVSRSEKLGYLLSGLVEAFKCLSLNLDTVNTDYTGEELIRLEVSSVSVFRFLQERRSYACDESLKVEFLDYFNRLPLPVQLVLESSALDLWASRYNSEEYVTVGSPKVEEALDWVSAFGGVD